MQDKKQDRKKEGLVEGLDKNSLSGSLYSDKTIRLDNAEFQDLISPVFRGSLLVISGASADIGNHMLVEYPVVIGRDAAGLPLHDGRISRRHVMVEPSEGRYYVRDLGSTNGTCLNGQILKDKTELQNGDRIVLGHTIIKFMLIDETEARYLRDIQHLAGIDSLTGLPAKHRFDSLLQEAIRTALAKDLSLSVMMMDMDGLKSINDKHGHHMGAHTISRVGGIIGRVVEGIGEASRFGGDEFCAMFPNIGIAEAMKIGEQIRLEVEKNEYKLKDTSVRATISIGVAELSENIKNENDLLSLADQALYRSKEKGRNNVSD